MKKIAMPLFGDRISPRFDCAEHFLIGRVANGEIIERTKFPADALGAPERVRKLFELGVDTLICGGIDSESLQLLRQNGIKIYSWVTGEVEDTLKCFLDGGLESGAMMGSGGRPRGRWRFKSAPWGGGRGGGGKGRGRGKGQRRGPRRGRSEY